MVTVNETIRYDPHHAAGPVGMRQHDRGFVQQFGMFAQLRLRRLGDLAREQAALRVESFDLCGEDAGAGWVIRNK